LIEFNRVLVKSKNIIDVLELFIVFPYRNHVLINSSFGRKCQELQVISCSLQLTLPSILLFMLCMQWLSWWFYEMQLHSKTARQA